MLLMALKDVCWHHAFLYLSFKKSKYSETILLPQ